MVKLWTFTIFAAAIYDLRSFIQKLDKEAELAVVKTEVDWKYELGAIARRVFGSLPGPALLFEKIKGYSTPIFVGGLQTIRRIAIALGLDPTIDEASININSYYGVSFRKAGRL